MLPDVTAEDWNQYEADNFNRGATRRIDAMTFSSAADQRISDLGQLNTGLGDVPQASPQPPQPTQPVEGPAVPAEPSVPPEPAQGPQGPMPADAPVLDLSKPPPYAPNAPIATPSPGSSVTAPPPPQPSAPSNLVTMALEAATEANVDPSLFAGLVGQESSWNPTARSSVGARGLTQLMPDTARGLGVNNVDDPQENLRGGARYLKSLLDRYNGDTIKALAAYNAGPGAVDKYGGVPPFKETQTYVDNIMGSLAQNQGGVGNVNPSTGGPALVPDATRAATPGRDISQFGDPQLTSEEAYAACGPAAAVRFAARFGRNPTLREATDLARSVGWTPGQGMAGLGSEKSLMDKLNVPTKLVQGAQWDVFAREAQTGNPVTISTAGHYFTADGYNPDTGAFHVGRSGLDLKGGSEWMTPAQMQRLMGAVQGGLLADNPSVPSPSTADQDTNPVGWLGRQKDALTSSISNAASNVSNAVSSTVGSLFPRGGTVTPSVGDVVGGVANDVLGATGLARTGQEGITQGPSGETPPDYAAAEQAGRARLAARGISLEPQGLTPVSPDVPSILRGPVLKTDQEILDETSPQGIQVARQTLALVGNRNPSDAQIADALRSESAGFAYAGSTTGESGGLLPGVSRMFHGTGSDFARPPVTPADLTVRTVSQQEARGLVGQAYDPSGRVTGPAYQSVIPEAFAKPPEPSSSIAQKIEDVRTALVRGFTDRQVDINQVQQRYAKALGRPLNANEMAAELQRLSADPAAQVYIDEGLKPAIQSVGDDYNALRDYVTLRSNVQVAEGAGTKVTAKTGNAAEGAQAAADRVFSGGLSRDESLARIDQIRNQLGPERFNTLEKAANQVSDFSRQLRQRLVDSGVLTEDQAAEMERLYPDWAKTRILDYMKDPAGGQGAGTKIGLADRQVREYSIEGTEKAREDPIASMVAYAHQAERMARKNEAFNAFLGMDQASPVPMLRKVAQDYTPTKDEVTIVGFVNGEKVKYVTGNKALGEAINGAGVMSTPGWTSAWSKVFRSFATSRNPVFLAGNAALDIPTYLFRESIRAGGPQHLPSILAELARGYGDAFQGLFQGEFRGSNTARLLKGGGGSGGYFTGSEGSQSFNLGANLYSKNLNVAQTASERLVQNLRRGNALEINGKADLLRLGKDLVTLQPVESLGERVELGPRVASMRLAEKRGANPVQAVTNARTVTVDFSQGGTVTKYLNNFIPFLNVGFQGPPQLARAFSENPRAFVATVGTLIGIPTIAAEVWNHADPQRAKDYADIPDYVKNQGVVVMLGGDAPTDAQGNRKPAYALIKLREWSPFASIARDATARVLGDDSKSWADMALDAGTGLSPTQSTSVGQAGTEALSGIPILPAAAQLQYNRDFFRNRDIVTQRNDENSSALAKSLTPAFQSVVDQFGLNAEVRPSAVDFFIRNQGAGVGGAILGASDMVGGKARQDTSPTSLPVVGGLAGRFVGTQTGQQLQNARDESLTASARQILRQSGITSTPSTIAGKVHDIPLRMEEEMRMQRLANQYLDDAVHRTAASADWSRIPQAAREGRMKAAMDAARARAEGEILATIPQNVRQQRQRMGSAAP